MEKRSGVDDFIADLDADNIAHLVTEDKSLMDAVNEYYNKLQENEEEYRKKYSWKIIHMKI